MTGIFVKTTVQAAFREKLRCIPLPRGFCAGSPVRSTTSIRYPGGLEVWPTFFTINEQEILLRASLQKLDNSESPRSRKKRRNYLKALSATILELPNVQDIFLPDEYYEFREGHYDGVIRGYREIHLTSWPEGFEGLSSVLERLYALCPTPSVQTHLLHLATHGHILPHIDNVNASGTWILGVSLGNERILRLEPAGGHASSLEVPLPSGSVYIQNGDVRYVCKHSIIHKPRGDIGQRLSIMIRDLPGATER